MEVGRGNLTGWTHSDTFARMDFGCFGWSVLLPKFMSQQKVHPGHLNWLTTEADNRLALDVPDQLEASSSHARSPTKRVSLVIVVLVFTHSASAASATLACSSDCHWLMDTTLLSSNITR